MGAEYLTMIFSHVVGGEDEVFLGGGGGQSSQPLRIWCNLTRPGGLYYAVMPMITLLHEECKSNVHLHAYVCMCPGGGSPSATGVFSWVCHSQPAIAF